MREKTKNFSANIGPKWKTIQMEGDKNRRLPKYKMTKMEDDQNRR